MANAHLLTDLRLDLRHHELRPVYAVATERRRVATEQRPLELTDLAPSTAATTSRRRSSCAC